MVMESARILNILVLFAGAGLATRGLLDGGHTCTDVEIQPEKVHLSKILNPEAEHITCDVMDLDPAFIASFDAVWASPPCQKRSSSQTTGNPENYIGYDDLLEWSLNLKNDVLWVENVIEKGGYNSWGKKFNAGQFLETPIQNRQRIIGGHYRNPHSYRQYKSSYLSEGHTPLPAVLAGLHKKLSVVGKVSYSKFKTLEMVLGYVPTLDEIAYLQGINAIPLNWYEPLDGYSWSKWQVNLYEAIGNGVPVYMARAFGEAYSKPEKGIRQMSLFDMENLTS
jgi:site-specific DNA-cytosine methylase